MAIPTDLIDMLDETWTSISAFCAGLTEAQWKTPTQLPGWSVQDNISHILAYENQIEGVGNPDHTAADTSNTKNALGEANEHQVDAYRALSGAQVLAAFNDITARRLASLRAGDDAYFAAETWTPIGQGTAIDMLHLRVMDSWTHEQDIRRSLGMPGHRSGPSAEHTVERMVRTVPMVVVKRAGAPDGSTTVIRVTGAVQRTIAVTNSEGKGSVSTDEPSSAVCTISMDSDVFLQLAMGRGDAAELAGQCAVEGDTDLGSRILSNFTMMI